MAGAKMPEDQPSTTSAAAKHKMKKPARAPNPVWRMMGLPNVRLRLPSRNWTIFFTIVGTFSAAVSYDKRESRRARRKWCKLVEHLAEEPLDSKTLPRRLTIFLEGPPGDSLRVAQDHFKEYVKPVLVASGIDWDFIQGRKEGDLRAALAEKIRTVRLPPEEIAAVEGPIARTRRANHVVELEGPRGDIVIGRHAWKEYVRGLHEGWLGPLKEPPSQDTNQEVGSHESAGHDNQPEPIADGSIETLPGITIHSVPTDQKSPSGSSSEASQIAADASKSSIQKPPFISTTDYPLVEVPDKLPQIMDASIPIPLPHVLGFSNTPLRLYRFLNRRQLADSIGRDTAAIILATSRPYRTSIDVSGSDDAPEYEEVNSTIGDTSGPPEQTTILQAEEKEWHKAAKKRSDDDGERIWLDEIVLDPRIARRMRKAELSQEDENRARSVSIPEEDVEGWVKGGLRSVYRMVRTFITTPGTPKASKSCEAIED